MEKNRKKISIWRILAYFIIYSFVGYVVETLFALINYNVIESRQSFMYGPFCGIYGFGAVVLILSLRFFDKNNYTLFLGGCLTGSIVEYTMSFLGELLFNARWWDYSKRFLNINGRICLLYALFWGILSLVLMKMINPVVDKIIDHIKLKLSPKLLKWLVGVATAFMLFDIIITGIAEELFLMRMAVEHNIDIKNKEVAESMYEKIYGNPKTVAIIDKFWGNKRMILTFPNITLRTKAGEIVYIRDLLPDIKPYFFKFEGNRIKNSLQILTFSDFSYIIVQVME